jgi:hypothetical protein
VHCAGIFLILVITINAGSLRMRMVWQGLLVMGLVACAPTPSLTAQDYLGHWQGVEGTSMTIAPAGAGKFTVVITDLDRSKSSIAELKKDGLHMQRGGMAHVIVPGNGDATGMKWLAGKTNCLVVAAHEGYCRD